MYLAISDCGDPTPANGIADIPKGTLYGASAFIDCQENYVLVGGVDLIYCIDGPTWSSYPQCIRGKSLISSVKL